MKQLQIHVLDLTRVDGSGEFACPHCGANISPNDVTDKTYSIMEAKVKNGSLEEVEIRCNKCASHICLTGFSMLQRVEGKRAASKEIPRSEIRTPPKRTF
jgi:hypothetical protein